ncbi:hypothetical protein ACOMHN_030556 [Nucella lapillus]
MQQTWHQQGNDKQDPSPSAGQFLQRRRQARGSLCGGCRHWTVPLATPPSVRGQPSDNGGLCCRQSAHSP